MNFLHSTVALLCWTGMLAQTGCQFEEGSAAPVEDSGIIIEADARGIDKVDGGTLDAAVTPSCFPVIGLEDDFNTAGFPQWAPSAEGQASLRRLSGTLWLELPSRPTGSASARIRSNTENFDLDGRRMFVEVKEIPNQFADTGLAFEIQNQASKGRYTFYLEENTLYFVRSGGDNETTVLGEVEFDLNLHRFWQMHVFNGVVHAEVGPALGSMTELGSEMLDSASKVEIVTNGAVSLIALVNNSSPNGGTGRFDNFNVGATECE